MRFALEHAIEGLDVLRSSAFRVFRAPASALALTKQLFHRVADLPLEAALERGAEANRRMRAFRKGRA